MEYRHQRGMSLVELMVVIGVIGVLSTVAMTNYREYQAKVLEKATLAVAKNLRTSLELIANELIEVDGVSFAKFSVFRYGNLTTVLAAIPNAAEEAAVKVKIANIFEDVSKDYVITIGTAFPHDYSIEVYNCKFRTLGVKHQDKLILSSKTQGFSTEVLPSVGKSHPKSNCPN